ncbi:MAG TPA: protein kinase [Terriglobales bacterium]|nr:protein kinase [Terriglobales bacterium]
MTPEQWQRIREILGEALELKPEERPAFLERACPADPLVRRQVESLLVWGDEARSSFLESPPLPVTLPVGAKLGDYEVQALIGSGGMGEVYRAHDTRLGRDVAVKVLLGLWSQDRDRLRRFEQEARAAAALNHPNIIAVFQMGTYQDAPYLVSELLEGATLREHLERGPLPVRKAIDYGVQMARGLDAAHEKGIAHRDLKPENLFVTKDGRLKILDFGLAKLTERQALPDVRATTISAETEPGMVMGTVGYMSPEQVRGEAADYRADFFAFGAILYEMLSGKRAFRKPTAVETMSAILNEDPTEISQLGPATPQPLQRVVQRCLEKNPDQRFQSAADLAFALEALSESGRAEALTETRPKAGISQRVKAKAAGVVLLLAFLVWFGGGRLREKLRPGARNIQSLAVLPLQNLSGDPAQDYFADGMTEELTAELSKIGAVRVISRTSAMRYKGANKSLPEIASELSVDGIIEGSVQRARDRVKITVQLIHAPTDTHVWADSYEGNMGDVLALQDDVARSIANEVKVKLTPPELTRLTSNRAVNPEAYEAYLKGRYYWSKRTPEGEQKGLEYFQQAVALDPGYAPAYSGVADSYIVLGAHRHLDVHEAFPKARAAATKALELDEGLAEAHVSLGTVKTFYDWDWAGSKREFQRALELRPNYSTAHHWYAHYLAAVGRVDEAVAEIKEARELDPFGITVNIWLARTLYYSRQYDQAIEQYRRTLELYPEWSDLHNGIGDCYALKGQLSEAVGEWEKGLQLSGENQLADSLRHAYAAGGYTIYLRKRLDHLKASAQTEPAAPLDFAYAFAKLGDKEHALEWLEKAYNERDPWLYLKADPVFDGLREEPRFKDLVRGMGLSQ